MKEALRKDRLAEIAKTKMRFLSILSLIALGVFVYTGLKATGANMRDTVDIYYREYEMPDITVQSTLGLDEEDEKIIKSAKGLEALEFGFMTDCLLDSDRNVIRLMSQPKGLALYDILEGEDLNTDDEILLDVKLKDYGYDIGQEMEVHLDDFQTDTLKIKKFNIVGFVKTPEYLSNKDRGKTNIGSGDVFGFGIIKPEAFDSPVYSTAKLRFEDTKNIESYTDQYEEKIDRHVKELRDKFKGRPENRFESVMEDARSEIEDAESQLESAKEQLKEGKEKLDQAGEDIEEGKKRLASEKADALRKLIEGEEQLSDGEYELKTAENKLEIGEIMKNTGERRIDRMQRDIADSQTSLNRAKGKLDALSSEITAMENRGNLTPEEERALERKKYRFNLALDDYNRILSRIRELQSEVSSNINMISNADSQLQSGEEALEQGKNRIEEGEKEYYRSKRDAERMLSEAQEELRKGEEEYTEGLKKYNEKKGDAEKQIAEGEEKLEDAKEAVSRLKKPIYMINSRLDSLDFYQFIDNSRRVDMLSNVFPVFFFGIAILVSLTTMTRMVEEERNLMGTLKALGYSNRDIIKKFTRYGLYSSVIGIAIGSVSGTYFLSKMIFDAYAAPYNILSEYVAFPHYKNIIIAAVISLMSTVGAAYWVGRKALKEKTANLMRPKVPKSGSRILLERIGPLWRKLSFIQKVTARNIFRYKKRMLMTVFGVAGCTALIFMGIGLENSLTGLTEKQYEEIFKFDAIIAFNTEDYPIEEYENALDNIDNVKKSLKVNYKSGDIMIPEFRHEDTMVISGEDEEKFSEFIKLRNRKTGEEYRLKDDGIFITEKIAEGAGLDIGDYLEFKDNEDKIYKLRIAGTAENYAGQYIYMNDVYYEKVFGEKFENNAYLAAAKDNSDYGMEEMSKELMSNKAVIAIISTNFIKNIINEMLQSIDMIVVVILICAALLAIVVLYNLTNINVSERERELSTIKVLGFFNKEVTAYVYRETIILTFMGIALGLVLGIYLHRYVLLSVEPPSIMLDHTTKWYNYLISSGFTVLVSLGVMIIIHNKLKNINMIESLKSVE